MKLKNNDMNCRLVNKEHSTIENLYLEEIYQTTTINKLSGALLTFKR